MQMAANSGSESGVRSYKHGQIVYLEIPARDVTASAAFYESVFRWEVNRAHSSFDAAGMYGHFLDDRAGATASGVILWINVDSMDGIVAAIRANGCEVLEEPYTQGPRTLATFRDPGGNAIGVAQHGSR
jgi:uncharacterized protein